MDLKSRRTRPPALKTANWPRVKNIRTATCYWMLLRSDGCLLYTSDAADEMD